MIKKYTFIIIAIVLGHTQINSMSWFKRTPKPETTITEKSETQFITAQEPKPRLYKLLYTSLEDTLKRCPINGPECLEAFEEYKEQISTKITYGCDSQSLYKAILQNRSLREIQRLVELGADVNSESGFLKVTPLQQIALQSESPENLAIAQYLIAKGADVNQISLLKSTALTFSARKNPELTKLLLKNGADIHQNEIDGQTALHLAAKNSIKPIIKTLIKHGADINAVNKNNGQTPISIAVKEGDLRTAANMVGWSLMKDYTDNKKDFYAPSFID